MKLKWWSFLGMLMVGKLFAQREQEFTTQLNYSLQPSLLGMQWDQKSLRMEFEESEKKLSYKVGGMVISNEIITSRADKVQMELGFEKFRQLNLQLEANYQLEESTYFRIQIMPQYFQVYNDPLSYSELQWGGGVYVGQRWFNKSYPVQLEAGFSRGWNLGRLTYYPTISLSGNISENWAFDLGFPFSSIDFKWQKYTNTMVFLEWDGLAVTYYETNPNITLDPILNTLSISKLNLGLKSTHQFDTNFTGTLTMGYSLKQNWQTDEVPIESNNSISGNGIYIGFGLNYTINWNN